MAYSIEIKNFKEGTLQFTFYQSGETVKNSLDAGELLKFVHNQQMYKPNSLEVELYITKTDVTINALNGQLVTLYEGSTIVAKEYFIFNVRKKGSYVTLKAYSADYFLTLDKFCQAFTAKKLVEDIINPTLAKCSTKNFDNFRKIAGTSAQGALAHFLNGELLPYAVQYNESFYDFMVRICNRNGEFLYSDVDNKLQVGLSTSKGSLPTTIEDGNVEYVNSYVDTQECSWVDSNYLAGSGSKLTKAEDGNETLKCYSAYGVYAPEFLEKIAGEEYCGWGDYTCFFTEFSTVLKSFADERTVYDASISCLKTITCNDSLYAYWVNTKNKIFQNTYPKEKELYSTLTTNKKSNINEIYLEIEKYQNNAQANQVRLFFSENPSVKLGDQIAYSGADYVVYEIHNNTYKDNTSYTNEYELLLVGKTKDGFYPLPMLEERVRKASAQRATVVDNFDPDRLGRVRVMYPWQTKLDDEDYLKEIKSENGENFDEKEKEDEIKQKYRNEIRNRSNSSPWIRVSVPMASDGAGFLFTPAVGDEVLIDYEDGNVERPYVCGAFYNAKNKPSIPAQAHNYDKVSSITSANGHHISFTDNGGSERFFTNNLPLIKMANAFGVHDNIIPGDKFFGGGFEISDYYGVYAIKGSTHGRSVDISSPFGTISIDALTGISINAPLGDVKIVGKNVSIEARNNLTIESGTNVKGYLDGTKSKDDFKQKLFESLESVVGDVLDLSHYRHLLEIFLRPIGGTMLLKSNRFMCIEVGEGQTKIDRQVETPDFKSIMLTTNRSVMQTIDKTIHDVTQIMSKVRSIYAIGNSTLRNLDRMVPTSDEELILMGDAIRTMISGDSIISLSKFTKKIEGVEESNKNVLMYSYESVLNMKNIVEKIYDKVKLRTNLLQPYVENTWNNFKKCLSNGTPEGYEFEMFNEREIIYNEVKACIESEKNLKDLVEMDAYDHNVRNLTTCIRNKQPKEEDSERSIKALFKDTIYKENIEKFIDDRIWAEPEKGALLVSNKKDEFLKMENNGRFTKSTPYQYAQEIINKLNQHFA